MTTYSVEILVPADCEVDGVDGGERAADDEEAADAAPSERTATVEVHEDEFVVAAAREQGVWLPAFCQQGWCTTCAAELLDGEVDQSAAKRYYDVDAEADLILACTAKPRSDLRLRACQQEAMLAHRDANGLPP